MDVFDIHERVITDYRAFTSGFVDVRDRRIEEFVDQQFAEGVQWLSLNPSFATGGAVPDLVDEGLLHPECARILWDSDGEPRIRRALRGMRWTIAGTVIFPSGRIDGQQTINQQRGIDHRIKDRFDLTLECIRRHYDGEPSPLTATLARCADFFTLFGDFRGYTDFFFLRGPVRNDRGVRFYLPFDGFDAEALPRDTDTYLAFCRRMNLFFQARTRRMRRYVHAGRTPSQRALIESTYWIDPRFGTRLSRVPRNTVDVRQGGSR